MRWFTRDTIVVTLLAITFGTNLLHYATYDADFSHSVLVLPLSVRDLTRPPGPRPADASNGLSARIRYGADYGDPTKQRHTVVVFFALIRVVTFADMVSI